MTQSQAVKHWLESAERNVKAADDAYKTNHFDWCLFLWHLIIEKTIKGLIYEKNKTPYPIHDLLKLIESTGLELSQEKIDWLNEITTFNIEARYDDFKLSFYKKANKKYATLWAARCREIYLWLKKEF